MENYIRINLNIIFMDSLEKFIFNLDGNCSSANSNSENIFYTDNLVRSAFAYIANWQGENCRVIDLYSYAVCLLEFLSVNEGYCPQSLCYLFKDDNLGCISTKGVRLTLEEITLPVPIANKIKILTRVYNSDSELFQEVPLTKQQTFEHACYLLVEDFVDFRKDQDHFVDFSSLLKVKNRFNLSEEFDFSLSLNPEGLVFLPSEGDEFEGFNVGWRS